MKVYFYEFDAEFNEWNIISMGFTKFEETPFCNNVSQTLSEFRVGEFDFEFNFD